MEVIVLQHINIEDPGYIKDLMIADGAQLKTIEFWKNLSTLLYGNLGEIKRMAWSSSALEQ